MKKETIKKIEDLLPHLTADELKDVRILANSQYEVRKKVAEKEFLTNEIIALDAQLKYIEPKPKPTLPKYVCRMIDYAIEYNKTLRWFFTQDARGKFPSAMEWYKGDDYGNVSDETGKRQLMIAQALMYGCLAEEPQTVCLRHIDMSKKDTNGNWYLAHEFTEVRHFWESGDKAPTDKKYQFTPEEIKEMNTGSYEIMEPGQ